MIIIVSGTPGTGKTTFAKRLAKENSYEYIDVNLLIKKERISENIDKKRNSLIVDTDKLNKHLIKIIKKHKKENTSCVIDSHLSHYLHKKYVDKCYITKCSLSELKKRLEKRNYSKKKVRENLNAEIFDTCRIEALEKGHNVKIINTDK